MAAATIGGTMLAYAVHGQSFSCRIGREPACLEIGDTVCSFMGKCVDKDASCFERYQCDYEGFTCKSNLTECAEKHDELVEKYNRLVSDFNDLLDKHTEVSRCVEYASSLQEAQDC